MEKNKNISPSIEEAKQFKADNVGIDPEIRKHIEDVFITLATD